MFALGTMQGQSSEGGMGQTMPDARLLYQRIERLGGELRLLERPEGREYAPWRWRNCENSLLSRPVYAVSPDGLRALVVQERFIWESGKGHYTFTLVRLEDADDTAKCPRLNVEFAYLLNYPVWQDNAHVLLGVSDEWKGDKGYREVLWNVDAGSIVLTAKRTLDAQRTERASKMRDAVARLPKAVLPEDIGRWLEDRRLLSPLELTPDGASVSVAGFWLERATASYISLAPSGKLLAIGDMGRSLAIITPDGRELHRVQPLAIFTNELTRIEELHWSRDEKWLLFTERHFLTRRPGLGVMHGPYVEEVLSVVRAINTQLGSVATLVRGEDASWLECP